MSSANAEGAQAVRRLAGEDARALDGDALRENERVARHASVRADEAFAGHQPEHRADDDRAVEAEGDLGVAADEVDVERGAGVGDLGEEGFGESGLGAFREEDGREEPLGLGAGAGDVVGVDVHGVPARHVAGEGDRVGLGDEKLRAAGVDDGGVVADARADDDARIAGLDSLQERGQEVVGELAGAIELVVPDWAS